MKFSVVIPVFNEAGSIGALQERLHEVMRKTSAEYEIIYVDDASNDSSPDILKGLTQRFAETRLISFKQNRGQSTALYAGFRAANGEWIITLDADGQNPPEEIPHLLEFCDKCDFVTGIREKRNDNVARKFSSIVARSVRRMVLGDTTTDTGCSLRIFRREIIESLPFFRNFHRFFPFLVKTMGFSIKEVGVAHNKRTSGESKYGIWKRLKEGIFDLWGVFWLNRRLIKYEVKHED